MIEGAMRSFPMLAFSIIIVIAIGIYALPHLNKNEFPNVKIKQGVVAVVYPGATAEEIEEQVAGKVEDYLFTFLSDLRVPYDNNASEQGVRKIKIKQKVSGCFRTDGGADDFAKLHSIAETAMKNGNSKYNAILALVQQ